MRLPSFFLALTIAAAPVAAQAPAKPLPAQPAMPDTSRIVAGTYAVEPRHTQIVFAVDHLGLSIFRGFLSGASGTLALDPKNPGATKLDVSIPVNTIFTTNPTLNQELIGPKFFDIQHWPDATFTSTSVLVGQDGKVLVNGNLTLHGQSRPVQMTVRLHGTGKTQAGKPAIGFDGRMAINRSEFGIAAVPLVSDQVQITVAAAFEQQ